MERTRPLRWAFSRWARGATRKVHWPSGWLAWQPIVNTPYYEAAEPQDVSLPGDEKVCNMLVANANNRASSNDKQGSTHE